MADYQYIHNSGIIVPDTADTLENVQAEFKNAFGNDLDISPETPQGVLISAETKARDTIIKHNAALANQINPNLAGGIFLDAIWALTGGARMAAEPSLLRNCYLQGKAYTEIPAGTLASVGEDGAVFTLISAVRLDENGKAYGTFQAVENGAIAVEVNTLNTIVTPILGFESITNLESAAIGRTMESDAAARLRRRKTLALQSVALPEAIVSALYDKNQITGVKSLSFLENPTSDTKNIEGIELKPHSIYVCVDGGLDSEIATIILRNKSLGCGYNGKIKIDVLEPLSGIHYPVYFDRPERINIFAKVTISNINTIIDPEKLVREAIVAYANGESEGETGLIVGADISPFELASAINAQYPSIYVHNIVLSQDGQNYEAKTIEIATNALATIAEGAIEVIVQ